MYNLKNWKKCLCAVLAAILLALPCLACAEKGAATGAGDGQLAMEDLEALGAKAYVHDGRVTFVEGPCTAEPVKSPEDAAKVVASMRTLLGCGERTGFEPWRTLADAAGNTYYVFQQVYAATTVSGGAVKVVTDAEGRMTGLSASVETELPDIPETEGITSAQAEEIVRKRLAKEDTKAEVVEGRSEIVILPVNRDIDPDSEEEKEESRFVWAVYSDNPGANAAAGTEYPYLAHYVAMDGEYLYSLLTVLPGDEASTSGYQAAYVFDGMEPAEYTAEVTLGNGKKKEITVSVMRDSRTGVYYLGDVERRIAVADCWEFLYNKGSVVLESSADNTGWDENSLLAMYNYSRARDYYKAIGWESGDGLGTPMLILKGFCNREREPQNNAAYAGKYYGWLVFLSSDANDFSGCLDILAHEFTHSVTHSVMTYSAYRNDFGAINEAVSDIQGELCEMMYGDTDASWELGENSSEKAFRSMSAPHGYRQPEYVWDVYYRANVKEPTEINDRGGVHTNSSLLNNVAYRLCANGGMTLEEARAFWFAVDCAMVPGTDYPQLSEMLPWVLEISGLGQYRSALETALDATRLRTEDVPDVLDADKALVTLELPDEESFLDGNWELFILTVDMAGVGQKLNEIAETDSPEAALEKLLQTGFSDVVYTGISAAGQDGRTIRMVAKPGRTIPVLFRMEIDQGEHVLSLGLAFYVLGRWWDIGSLAAPLLDSLSAKDQASAQQEEAEPAEAGTEAVTEGGDGEEDEPDLSWLDDLLSGASDNKEGTPVPELPSWLTNLLDLGWQLVKELLFFEIRGGEVNVIPSDGLEEVLVLDSERYPALLGTFGKLPETVEGK